VARMGNMRNAYLNDLDADGVDRNEMNIEKIGCAWDAWSQLALDSVLTDSRKCGNPEVARRFGPPLPTCSNDRKSFAIYHST
jgi:hypothetical protein